MLKRAAVVVDVSNSPSFDEEVAMNFFNTATRNLIQYELAAGVRHHVALSVNAPQQSCQGGNTRSALYFDSFPIYISPSWGATVEDVDGHAYLDVLGEFTAGLYGHSDEQLAKAMSDTLGRGISNGEPKRGNRAGRVVCGRFPGIEKIRFCNSGTEANRALWRRGEPRAELR